jgi:hypothetical protein
MTDEITNDQDIIDSRDILERIQYIEQLLGEGELDGEEVVEDLQKELEDLQDLVEQCKGCGDFKHGEALIHDDYFQEYVEELAYDIGDAKRDAPWPQQFIDWEAASDALKIDYISVDFDGEEYWIRA